MDPFDFELESARSRVSRALVPVAPLPTLYRVSSIVGPTHTASGKVASAAPFFEAEARLRRVAQRLVAGRRAFASASVSSSSEVSEAWHEIRKVGNKNRRVCTRRSGGAPGTVWIDGEEG